MAVAVVMPVFVVAIVVGGILIDVCAAATASATAPLLPLLALLLSGFMR